jgi:uncharacterized protein YlzI (FlbEa/FlbD family)
MASKFVDIKLIDGNRLIVNTNYIFQVSPTHGTDFANGADVVFIVYGEDGVGQVSVPATAVNELLNVLHADNGSQFIEVTVLNGAKVILNKDYITHVQAMHGNDLTNGAVLTVFGVQVEIGAKEVHALLPLLV